MHPEIPCEDLAAYLDADLDVDRRRELDGHLAACQACQERLATLRRADTGLRMLGRAAVPAQAVLRAYQAVSAELAPPPPAEVLMLEQAAAMLQVTPRELAEVMDELPLFEIAGQLRIRRARLLEWVQQRERNYSRQRSESWAARAAAGVGKGVA